MVTRNEDEKLKSELAEVRHTVITDILGIVCGWFIFGIVLWGIGGVGLRLSAAISLIIAWLVVALRGRWEEHHVEIIKKLNAIEARATEIMERD